MKRYSPNIALTTVFIFIATLAFGQLSYGGVADITSDLKTSQIKDDGQSAGGGKGAPSSDGTGVIMAGKLNVRSGPWAGILGTLKKGQKVDIEGKSGEWYKIKYNGKTAYIHSAYVATENAPSGGSDGYVNVNESLNVRTGPWGTKIGKLGRGAGIDIVGKQGEWYKIKYNGKTAFVHSAYISKSPINPKTGGSSSGGGGSKSSSGGGSGHSSAPAGKAGLSHPFSGSCNVGSKYGMRMHPIYHVKKMHNGVDIGKPTGTPLLAMGDGKVIFSGWAGTAGYMVKIKYSNGYTSTYMHCLSSGALHVGTKVTKGQHVAKVNSTGASTGPHLHLEITNPSGSRINPQNVL